MTCSNLKQFSRYRAEQESYLAQNKSMTGIQAYKRFYETFDRLEENRRDQMKLLKAKYQDPFASDTKRMLDEKKKILSWLLNDVPDKCRFTKRSQRLSSIHTPILR